MLQPFFGVKGMGDSMLWGYREDMSREMLPEYNRFRSVLYPYLERDNWSARISESQRR